MTVIDFAYYSLINWQKEENQSLIMISNMMLKVNYISCFANGDPFFYHPDLVQYQDIFLTVYIYLVNSTLLYNHIEMFRLMLDCVHQFYIASKPTW